MVAGKNFDELDKIKAIHHKFYQFKILYSIFNEEPSHTVMIKVAIRLLLMDNYWANS